VVVTIRLFAMLRERAGATEIELELPEGARVRDALDRLDDLAGGRLSAFHSPSSRFQIGASALMRSMISRAPANASLRCGALAATATDGSDSGTVPTRCSAAALHRPCRSIASATMARMRSSAIWA